MTYTKCKRRISEVWKSNLFKTKVSAFLSTAQNIQDGHHFIETPVTLVPEQQMGQ